jgi:hypothetical protein
MPIIEDLKPRLLGSLMWLLHAAAGLLLVLMQVAIVGVSGYVLIRLFI